MKPVEVEELLKALDDAEGTAGVEATASSAAVKLASAERQLDQQLEEHVSGSWRDLLTQATGAELLEDQLSSLALRSAALLQAAQRARARVLDPYEALRSQTLTLGRLQATCDLLRRVVRIVQLGKRLRQQLQLLNHQGSPAPSGASSAEIAKAALTVSELQELWEGNPEAEDGDDDDPSDPALSGVEAVEAEQRLLRTARAEVERRADDMLTSGMETRNQSRIGIALQVYFNLNVMEGKMDRAMADRVKDIKAKLASHLDLKKLQPPPATARDGPAGKQPPAAGSMANIRTSLWNGVEGALDAVHVLVSEAMQLQKVLCKKRDSQGRSFFELLEQSKDGDNLGDARIADGPAWGRGQVVSHVWTVALTSLKADLTRLAADSAAVRTCLEAEYPKLLKLFKDLWHRLCQVGHSCLDADPSVTTSSVDNPFRDSSESCREVVKETLGDFERAYLSRSLSRLFDPVNLMFAPSGARSTRGASQGPGDLPRGEAVPVACPSVEELEQVFEAIGSECAVASRVDDDLNVSVARNVAKTVRLMCARCEQSMSDDLGETSQVVDYPTEAQRRNVHLVNTLHAFRTGILERNVAAGTATAGPGDSRGRRLSRRESATAVIAEALVEVRQLMAATLKPLLNSVGDAVDAIIHTVHQEEDFVKDDPNFKAIKLSPFLKELKTFLARICNDFLKPFDCKDLVAIEAAELIFRVADCFVQHGALLRPLGSVGRSCLIYDCSQMERAVLDPLIVLASAPEQDAPESSPADGGNKSRDTVDRALAKIKAFEAMLSAGTAEDVAGLETLKDGTLRYSTALHYLFSLAPAELKSPHDSAGWSISRYSRWLEDHRDESERLQLIRGALESYVAGTRLRREKSYAHPYPVMLELLQTAFSSGRLRLPADI